MNSEMLVDADTDLTAVVYDRIKSQGGIEVPRGKFFVRNLARVLDIKGVNRRLIHQSVLQLLRENKITQWTTTRAGGGRREATRYVNFRPTGSVPGRKLRGDDPVARTINARGSLTYTSLGRLLFHNTIAEVCGVSASRTLELLDLVDMYVATGAVERTVSSRPVPVTGSHGDVNMGTEYTYTLTPLSV